MDRLDRMTAQQRDVMIARGMEAGARADAAEPRAKSARYDPGKDQIVITLRNDVEIAIPRRHLQGLQRASPEALSDIVIDGGGYGLHWDTLDADFTVPGLVAGIFGTGAWMARLAGSSRSEAKAAASRRNGALGGRPRKSRELHETVSGTR